MYNGARQLKMPHPARMYADFGIDVDPKIWLNASTWLIEYRLTRGFFPDRLKFAPLKGWTMILCNSQ